MKKLVLLQIILAAIAVGRVEAQNLQPLYVSGNIAELEGTRSFSRLTQIGTRNNIKLAVANYSGSKQLVVRVPMNYCEALPVYYYYRQASDMGFTANELYFFVDESKRQITTDAGCASYEVVFNLTSEMVESTDISARGQLGLILPNLQNARPFNQNISSADLTKTATGSVTIGTYQNENGSLEISITRESESGAWH